MNKLKWKFIEEMRCGCWEMKYGLKDARSVGELYNIPVRSLRRYIKLLDEGDKRYDVLLLKNNPPDIIKKYRKIDLETDLEMNNRLNLALAKCTGLLQKKIKKI